MDNALANPLIEDFGQFQNDLADGFDENLSGASEGMRQNPDGTASGVFMYHYIGEDGLPYRENRTWNEATQSLDVEQTDERVYYWQPSNEHKVTGREDAVMADAMDDQFTGSQGAGFYTKEEIQNAWNNGEMAQIEGQGVTWDEYWSFVDGVSTHIANGGAASMEDEGYRALVDGLGIQTQYESRGDVFNFNGFGYSRDYFADKTDAPVELINATFLSIVGSQIAGPMLASALTPALGAAGAQAASSAILSLTQDALTTGDLSFQDALLSAGVAYLGEEFRDVIGGVAGDAVGEGQSIRDGLLEKFARHGIDPNSVRGKELFDKLMRQYEMLQKAGELGGKAADIVGAIWSAYEDSEAEVDYGGATSEITGDGPDIGDDFGVDTDIEMPTVDKPDPDVDGGGGSTDGGDSGGDSADPSNPVDPTGPENPGGSGGDPDWRYENGVWTNGTDIIYGPGNEGDTMTDEEMADAFENGTHTNADGLGDGGSNDDGDSGDGGDTEEETPSKVWSPVHGGFVDPSILDPKPPSNDGTDPSNGTNPDGGSSSGTGTNPEVGGETPGNPNLPGGGPNSPGNDGSGDGNGDGNGDGDGDGNGDGDGFGNGDGLMALAGSGNGRDRPVWSQLFAQPQFRKHTPYQSKVTQSLFGDLMGIKR